MPHGRILTFTYIALSTVICFCIISFLNSSPRHIFAPQQVEAQELTPVQAALVEHINRIEDPDYRHMLIFRRINKLLEENSYTADTLQFAEEFVPENGREYTPKDIVVTDSALILKKYANIPEDTDHARLTVLNTGSCLIDSVPYFWGGKASYKGWNDRWGQDVVVSSGSFIAEVAAEGGNELRKADAEGTQVLIPYGLDCSGFVDWAYWTALNYRIGYSTREQWANSNEITAEELLPGDLGFLCTPSDPMVNHVGMYIGKNDDGEMMWLHCFSGSGVNISSPEFIYYRRPNIDIYYQTE